MDSHASTRGSPGGATGNPSAPPSGNGGRLGPDPAAPSPGEAFQQAAGRLGELKEYAGYLIAAKVDSYKASITNLVIYAVLGIVGAVAGCVFVGAAVVLLLSGLAGAVGHLSSYLFGPSWHWLGPFVVGLLILGGMAAGVIFGLKWFMRTSHSRLVAKYEDRKRQQRTEYGFDVKQRAREQRVQEQQRAAAE